MKRGKSASLVVLCAVSLSLSPVALAAKKAPQWESNLNNGRQALTRGDFPEADRLLKSALDNTRFFKDGDPRMGVTLRSMGDLYLRQQSWSLAKEYFERALAVEQKLCGPESLEVGDDLYGLALASQQLGDHLAAEIFLKRVEEVWRKKLGLNNSRLLSILPAMGAYASMKNDFAAAESYYKQVVALAEKEYGSSSPKTGAYLNLLATVQGNAGKFAEAKDNATKAVVLLKNDPRGTIAFESAQDNLRIVERNATPPESGSPEPAVVSSDSSKQSQPIAKSSELDSNKTPPAEVSSTTERAPESGSPQPAVVSSDSSKQSQPIAKSSDLDSNKTPPAEVSSTTERAPQSGSPEPAVVSTDSSKQSLPIAKSSDLDLNKGKQADRTEAGQGTVDNTKAKIDSTAVSAPRITAEAQSQQHRRPWETDKPLARDSHQPQQSWGKVRYLADGKLITAEQYKAMLLAGEAYEMMQQEKYRMAADMLRKALDLYPNLPSAHTNLGLALSRLGQTSEATEHLKIAIALDPSRSAPWVNLAGCFQTSGRLKESVETYKEYLNRFPDDSLAFKARDIVKHLMDEVNEQQAVEQEVASAGSVPKSDYFPYTTHEGVIKWTDKNMPLKVHVANGAKIPGYKPEFEGLFIDAFKQWVAASGDRIKLELVARPEAANIECEWTNDYSKVSSPSEGGEARVTWTEDGIKHAKIIILTADPTPDSPLSNNQIRAVCMHEIGHSLGLMGHSPDPTDIMYCTMPSAETKPTISARDAGTLKKLYAPDVMIALKPRKHVDAKDAITSEGVDLMRSKAYAQAVDKFEEALKLDPDYEPARENLARAYNNYALELAEKGKAEQAESLFQKAMNVQTKLRDLAVKMTTMENYAKLLRRLRRDSEAERIELQAKSLKEQ